MRSIRPAVLRLWCAGLGVLATLGYAALMAVQLLVLNPLAAVPGVSLAQINADLAAHGESLEAPLVITVTVVAGVIAVASIGWALYRRWSPVRLLALVLGLLIGGGPLYFMLSVGPGMSLADTYGIAGGDHTPWGQVLLVISAAALATVLLITLLGGWQAALADEQRR